MQETPKGEGSTRRSDAPSTPAGVEPVAITKVGQLFRRGAAVPAGAPFMFFAFRVSAGFLWLSNGVVKTPFNNWGYFPEWVDKFAENSPIPPYKWFLENAVQPYIDFWGWVQFLLETALGVLLILGLFTALAGLVATAWAANIAVGSVFVPGEWAWGVFAFWLMMPLVWATRSGRFVGLDAALRPRWLASERPLYRRIAKWGT